MISIVHISTPDQVIAGRDLFGASTSKLAINLASLTGPVLVAAYLNSLARVSRHRTSVGLKFIILIVLTFLFFAFFPLWLLQTLTNHHLSTLTLILFLYVFQLSIVFFLFQLKP